MKYFSTELTSEQIKAEYRRLCKLYHPDLHRGDESDDWNARMKEINAEFAIASNSARRAEEPTRRKAKGQDAPTEADYKDMADIDECIRQAIESIIRFDFLEIEICGQWVWVDGTQKRGTSPINDEALDALMKSNYKWAAQKGRWFFAGVPAGKHFRAWDMDEIRREHGSVRVKHGKSQDDSNSGQAGYLPA